MDYAVLGHFRDSVLDLEAEGVLKEGSVRCLLMIVNAVMGQAFQTQMVSEMFHIPPRVRKKKNVVQVYSREEQQKLEYYFHSSFEFKKNQMERLSELFGSSGYWEESEE